MSILNKIKNVKNKVVDKVSDVMAMPATMRMNKAMKKAEQDVADIKFVREARGVDTSDKDWRDPLFRARANVSGLKFEAEYAAKRAEANKSR